MKCRVIVGFWNAATGVALRRGAVVDHPEDLPLPHYLQPLNPGEVSVRAKTRGPREVSKPVIPDQQDIGLGKELQDDDPLVSLRDLGKGTAAGLRDVHGINNVGDLRIALSDPDMVKELLDSDAVSLGQATIDNYKRQLGVEV